jgi:hypothetical protein
MRLSFVVPAYNEEAYLPACLESVLAQTRELGDAVEIIVVNNASSDRTREVALGYSGVRVVDEPRKGLTFARQAGFVDTALCLRSSRASGIRRDDHRKGTALPRPRVGSFVPGWQSPRRTVYRAKKKDTFPCPFPGFSPGENQEDQTDYMLNTTPDDLAFRKATNANPRRPVPSNISELGSGTGVSKLIVPPDKSLVPFFSRGSTIVIEFLCVLKTSVPELAIKPWSPNRAVMAELTLSTVKAPEYSPVPPDLDAYAPLFQAPVRQT